MTLSQLRYLVAVDRYRSFRGAAEACHVSQPALSMQVQKLEETLGLRVFDRSRQPVVPTDVGIAILGQARVVLRESERMADIVVETGGALRGRYRLGIIPTLAPTLLPLFLPAFSKAHPGVELVVEELQTETMLERLSSDTLDGGLAATPLHAPGVRERPLYREAFYVYVSPRHPFAKRKKIRQSELVDEPVWILGEGHCFREQVLQLCKVDRPVLSREGGMVRFEGGSFETLIRLVDSDFGLTILPDLVVRALPRSKRRTWVRKFADPVPTREVSLIAVRDHLKKGVADALVDELLRALPEDLAAAARAGVGRVVSPLASPARST